jgi:ATP-dependent exoDNAse (exonuclease V) alpha subunit
VRAAGWVTTSLSLPSPGALLATGDRLMFLRNEGRPSGDYSPAQAVAVKNGTLGTVLAIATGGERLAARLDGVEQK